MASVSSLNRKKAQKLHDEGQELHDRSDEDGAIAKYMEAIALDPERSESHYNIGLIYKYRNDWKNSFAFNQTAYRLDPEDEAARWNLAIAATALRDWKTARQAWRDNGIDLDGGDGPINEDFGPTPVRLNPDGDGEVVWSRRIDPVRASITNIPLPESGFAWGDIVLHDGAAVGHRIWNEREYSVFNVLELFEPSTFSTFRLTVEVPTEADLTALEEVFDRYRMMTEDWSASIHMLCKACSEGTPHEHHEHDPANDDGWNPVRQLGIAARSVKDIETVLADQALAGITVKELICELAAQDRIGR